jgi:hypothetical protein
MSLHQRTITIVASVALLLISGSGVPARAQTPAAAPAPAAAAAPAAPALLSADDLAILVARIALYPDDLVALVLSAALNPLEIVQAQRFLDQSKAKPDAKPDASWDGSIISLLNYPTVLKMMNDDLDWTQQLGDAVVNQQKDVLMAIQQLRDKAVANGVIKSNDKVIVEKQNNNVVIRPAKKEVTYVPAYDPVILTSPTYVAAAPIIYGDPYPSYYYPYAPYWAGFVTGVAWGAAVDWNRWNSWGGNDIDINVNNFNRNDYHFDRTNINNLNFDKNNFNFDSTSIQNNLRQNNANRLDLKGGTQLGSLGGLAGSSGSRVQSSDVRRDVQNQLKQRGQANAARSLPNQANRNAGQAVANRNQGQAAANRPNVNRAHVSRPQTPRHKPAARMDTRPRQPSALGNYSPGRHARVASQRGNGSLGGRGGGRRFEGGGGGRRGGGGRFHR